MNSFKDLWRLLKPLQWIKSSFVFTGVLFGKRYDDKALMLEAIATAIAFALVSSSVYIMNDLVDCQSDQKHPQKKKRPLPSGKVSPPAALILGAFLLATGLALAWLVSGKVLAITSGYFLLNIAYSFYLKHVVIVDVFCIAAGFMLRILAGTIGIGIPPSQWLLLCSLMITLFLGFAKRRAELIALEEMNKGEHRQVLENYSPVMLDQISAICATGVIITYSLYTTSTDTITIHQTSSLIYTVPLVIYALFRYLFLLHHRKSGGDPTRDLINDSHIASSILLWIILTVYLIA